jgi:methyl-accepting chemotaxis protein/aerotaxis receptor
MRNNQPVTQRELELKEDDFLVSRTDTKGRITYANPAFIDISGFEHAELMGASHNLVRHPDMPPAAFENLWQTAQKGETWRGLVKNRCKNGDHYWVRAYAIPVLGKNGEVQELQSIRSQLEPEAQARAEKLYANLRKG